MSTYFARCFPGFRDRKASGGRDLEDNDPSRDGRQVLPANHQLNKGDLENNGTLNFEVLRLDPRNDEPYPDALQSLPENKQPKERDLGENTLFNGDSVSVNSNFKERLQKNYYKLLNCLCSTDDIAARLFQRGNITKLQLEVTQLEKNKIRKIELLLDIIQLGDERVFDSFSNILLETGQSFLFRLLSEEIDFNLDHVQLIQNNYTYLAETIDPASGLLECMVQSESLTRREHEEINSIESAFKRNEELSMLLMRKDSEKFHHFLEALRYSQQEHVAQRLIPNSDAGMVNKNEDNEPNESRYQHSHDIDKQYCNILRKMLNGIDIQFNDLPDETRKWLSLKKIILDSKNDRYIKTILQCYKSEVLDLRQQIFAFESMKKTERSEEVARTQKILDLKNKVEENFQRILAEDMKAEDNSASLERKNCQSEIEVEKQNVELKACQRKIRCRPGATPQLHRNHTATPSQPHRNHIATTPKRGTRRNHPTITPQPHRHHTAKTSHSHRNYNAIKSQPQRSHTATKSQSHSNQNAATPRPHRNQTSTTPQPHRNNTATSSQSHHNHIATISRPNPTQTRNTPQPPHNHTATTSQPHRNNIATTPQSDRNQTATTPQTHRNQTATTPQPHRNQIATTPQPHRNHSSTTPQPPRNHTETTSQPHRNHIAATTQPPRNHTQSRNTPHTPSNPTATTPQPHHNNIESTS